MDYFKFTCPHCQTRIGTSPDTSGHTVQCPSCQCDVIIPPAPANEGEVVPGIALAAPEPKPDVEATEHTMMLRKSDLKGGSAVDPFDGPTVPDMGKLDEDNPFGGASTEQKKEESKPAAPTPSAADPFDGPATPDMTKLDDGNNPFGAPAADSKPEDKPATPEPPKTEDKPEEKKEEPKPEEKKEEDKPAEPEKPAETEKPAEAPAPTPEEPEEEKKKPEPQKELISTLTTEVKVGLVKQARTHIADESIWIHGRSGPGGKVVLAAKKSGDTIVPLKPGSSEATHYSIVGALLVAMDEINVKSTAGGRSEFLHYEIEEAAREVTGKEKDDKVDPMNLSHKDCVAALDFLLKKYRKSLGEDDFEDLITGKKSSGSGSSALDDLLAKDDDDLNLKDVIKALNDEIGQLQRRLDELEKTDE